MPYLYNTSIFQYIFYQFLNLVGSVSCFKIFIFLFLFSFSKKMFFKTNFMASIQLHNEHSESIEFKSINYEIHRNVQKSVCFTDIELKLVLVVAESHPPHIPRDQIRSSFKVSGSLNSLQRNCRIKTQTNLWQFILFIRNFSPTDF